MLIWMIYEHDMKLVANFVKILNGSRESNIFKTSNNLRNNDMQDICFK